MIYKNIIRHKLYFLKDLFFTFVIKCSFYSESFIVAGHDTISPARLAVCLLVTLPGVS